MAMPKSVTKIDKNGVKFIDSVDRAEYTLMELSRAALRDTGKFVTREARKKAPKNTGRGKRAIQYWNKKREAELQVGIKPEGFYMGFSELGTEGQPKVGMITNTVEQNIDKIREIQGQYLSAIANENQALSLIDESEEISNDD